MDSSRRKPLDNSGALRGKDPCVVSPHAGDGGEQEADLACAVALDEEQRHQDAAGDADDVIYLIQHTEKAITV